MAAAPPPAAPVDESHHNDRRHPTPAPSSSGRARSASQPENDSAMNNGNNRAPPAGGRFTEDWDASQRGSSVVDGPRSRSPGPRPASRGSTAAEDAAHARGNTLRKKSSARRSLSLRRSSGGRSTRAGSVPSLAVHPEPDESQSAFHCPVPTKGNPTDALAARFQAWRKFLKELISYFKEVQSQYDARAKSATKLTNAANHITPPAGLLAPKGSLDEAMRIVRRQNDTATRDASRASEAISDIVAALSSLRRDLKSKIKEIKNLSGDFHNAVDKEMDGTKKHAKSLHDALGQAEVDASNATGKQDPYLLRMTVDRQVEKQIEEENYLHQAYLNLESSGRELDSIIVGEIQKAHDAYASVLQREADAANSTADELRTGFVEVAGDEEWDHFMRDNDRFVDPSVQLRALEDIHYPGHDHKVCQEVREGLLERKSKYLKSYTAGWYVLSPTHLHEFKSADKDQAPVMSLYLPDQKLGSHSQEGTASQKFILKGRQTGTMHRGHTWVFRAESHDTMMAWYNDLQVLTERTTRQRGEMFGLTRTGSKASRQSSSSDAHIMDEEDEEPFGAGETVDVSARDGAAGKRSQPGGTFPSGMQGDAQRGTEDSTSSASSNSSGRGNGTVNFAGDSRRDAGPSYDTAQGRAGAQADEPSHVSAAPQARDNPYANEGLYHPRPVHGAPVTTIYQYEPPSRRNSYAEGVADGARMVSQGQDGHFAQGPGAVPRRVPDPSSYQEAGQYQPTAGDGGQQGGEYTTSSWAESSVPTGASADSARDSTGEAPRQGMGRTSNLDRMHVPGDYPRSAANVPGEVATGQTGQN